jgi:hypothetical protein
MTLTELQAEVYTLTNRPDLVAQTLTAVRAATLKAHQADYYWKDLFETGVSFDSALFLQSLDYRTLIPLFRSMKYIRKATSNGTLGAVLTLKLPETVFDSYNEEIVDVYYMAGFVVQIKSSTALQYIALGCYLNPNISVSGYNSWIALDHPYAIVYEAAAAVFKMIGKTEEFSAYSSLALDQRMEVGLSNILGNGY